MHSSRPKSLIRGLERRWPGALEVLGLGWESRAYGHLSIWREYAHVPAWTPLVGHAQHGWEQTWIDSVPFMRTPWPHSYFVWSSRRAEFLSQFARVQAVGSPWVYMRLLSRRSGDEAAIRSAARDYSLIVPTHGASWGAHDASVEGISTLLKQLVTVASHRPVLCLYWTEFQNPIWMSAAKGLQLPVVTAGHPDSSARGNDHHSFLWNLYAILNRAAEVVVHDVVSTMIYAADLGIPVRIVPEWLYFDWSKTAHGKGQSAEHLNILWRQFAELVFDDWEFRSSQGTLAEYAHAELGYESVKSPRELRSALGWSTPLSYPARVGRDTIRMVEAAIQRKRGITIRHNHSERLQGSVLAAHQSSQVGGGPPSQKPKSQGFSP